MKAPQQVHPSQRQECQQLSGLSPRKSKDKSSLASQTSAQRELSQSPYMQEMMGYQQMANNSAQVKEAVSLQAMADRSPQVQAGIQMQAAADAYVRANDLFNSTQSSTVQDSCSSELTPTTQSAALSGKNFAPADCIQCFQDTSSSTEERETRLSKLFDRPQQQTAEKTENRTDLPDKLKSGVENLSGLSMDDVRVHYNSGKPAQLQAHAYTQGTDIHVAPGQKRYLPHEAWHVVQQKQGRVKPTMQMKGVGVNDDTGLEREADVMGGKALKMKLHNEAIIPFADSKNEGLVQRRTQEIANHSTANDATVQMVGEANWTPPGGHVAPIGAPSSHARARGSRRNSRLNSNWTPPGGQHVAPIGAPPGSTARRSAESTKAKLESYRQQLQDKGTYGTDQLQSLIIAYFRGNINGVSTNTENDRAAMQFIMEKHGNQGAIFYNLIAFSSLKHASWADELSFNGICHDYSGHDYSKRRSSFEGIKANGKKIVVFEGQECAHSGIIDGDAVLHTASQVPFLMRTPINRFIAAFGEPNIAYDA